MGIGAMPIFIIIICTACIQPTPLQRNSKPIWPDYDRIHAGFVSETSVTNSDFSRAISQASPTA